MKELMIFLILFIIGVLCYIVYAYSWIARNPIKVKAPALGYPYNPHSYPIIREDKYKVETLQSEIIISDVYANSAIDYRKMEIDRQKYEIARKLIPYIEHTIKEDYMWYYERCKVSRCEFKFLVKQPE